MISNSQTVQGDDERDRRLAEAEILVKIADIEKAAASAQAATLRSQNNRLEDLLRRETQAHEEAIRRLASVAATQIGRAFIAAALEGLWPLRRWLSSRRARSAGWGPLRRLSLPECP